ncbi:MAG: hypothetical protein PWQ82_1610 [Thermosediminibacterales bacterium]|nr:hypothetical protein [Thermosediminibacterales bacterium]MDK2836287.1 hypothetical protein [Thermosediminibacterales bacterium]
MKGHVDKLISAYIDGELSKEEHELVENHLMTCNKCRGLLEQLSSQRKMVQEVFYSLEIPDTIEENVMNAINTNSYMPVPSDSKVTWFSWIVMLLGLMILLLGPSYTIFGTGFASSIVSIVLSFLHMAPLLTSMVPFLIEGLLTFAVIVLLISVWSLRRLLV